MLLRWYDARLASFFWHASQGAPLPSGWYYVSVSISVSGNFSTDSHAVGCIEGVMVSLDRARLGFILKSGLGYAVPASCDLALYWCFF